MEILIHRRLLKDDNRGVGEPLNETQSISPYDWKDDEDIVHREPVRIGKGLVVRGTHTISLTTPAKAAREYRRLQDELYYSPVLGFSVGTSFGSDQDFRSGLAVKLPKNVAILTVEMQPSGSVLVLPLPLYSMPHSPFPLLLLLNRHHCLQMNRIGWKTSTLALSLALSYIGPVLGPVLCPVLHWPCPWFSPSLALSLGFSWFLAGPSAQEPAHHPMPDHQCLFTTVFLYRCVWATSMPSGRMRSCRWMLHCPSPHCSSRHISQSRRVLKSCPSRQIRARSKCW